VIATALIFTGIITGVLGVLDIFLSKNQKDAIDGYILRFWDWLSDAQKFSLVGWLLNPAFRVWFALAAGGITTVAALLFLFQNGFSFERGAWRLTGIVVAAVAVGGGIGIAATHLILGRSPKAAPIWAIIYFVLALIGWVFLVIWGTSSCG
jgi:hypothetical protein